MATDSSKSSGALFDVFLRLRPNSNNAIRTRFLDVERERDHPTHITIKPPVNDHRKRAIEKFAFTRVFEEHAGQLELFESTGILQLIQGVLGVGTDKSNGKNGRDGLLATLGVTGSGKSHTILGSKSQRGLTQLTLDLLFQSVSSSLADMRSSTSNLSSLCSADTSEAHLRTASGFLDDMYGDVTPSRGATPGPDSSFLFPTTSKRGVPAVSSLPQYPPITDVSIDVDPRNEYAIVVSMYEVYNDRIFDLLTVSTTTKFQQKRRALLFKNTELSPDLKVVAGLRKVVCSSFEEALLVLETGLHERRVAGTGSNATSSRSHGFFNIEVKKRRKSSIPQPWASNILTIADLAGSERARAANTAGSTLAEAGKINESLMYLGQCMQIQSGNSTGSAPGLVPFRQCKLTELLFHNSFTQHGHKTRTKAIMIVTADPLGDFNATSQILRYSALAREVTVPRIPSVSSILLADATSRPGTADGSATASALQLDLQNALEELTRLREELEITQMILNEETRRRHDAEESWRVATDRLGDAESRIEQVESEVRDELCSEMESRLAHEMRRWRAAREAELDYQDAHLDRKLEVYAQGLHIHEDSKENTNTERGEDKGARSIVKLAELDNENELLRQQIKELEQRNTRDLAMRSPSKKMRVLKTRKWEGSGMGLDDCTE